MPPLQQHIEDSLEKFDQKCNTRIEKGGFTYLYERDDHLSQEDIKSFIKQSLLEQADILRGEVEEIVRKWTLYHLDETKASMLASDIKRELDLLEINQTTKIDETEKCYLTYDDSGEKCCTYNHTMGALCLNGRCQYCHSLYCTCYQDDLKTNQE